MVLQTQIGAPQTYGAVEAAGPGVVIPDAKLLFTADFSRAGHDLVLTGSDGAKFLVTGYFNSDTPPSLISPEGAKLTGDVVTSLAGPQFPGQYAQAGDAASGKTAIGKVESSSGSASAVRSDGTTVTLKAGDPVFQGDVVLTGPGSKLGISFVDGTIFSLTANARMVLNSLVYDPDGGKSNSMLFSLVEGSFVFAAGQIAPTGDMKIQTPVATMGIRGTAPTVDIVAGLTNGGVIFSIIPDPGDGHVGAYTLYSLDTGLPIGNVSSVGTKWQLTSAQGQILELDKTEADLLNDANAVGQINNIYSQWQSSTQQNTDGPQAGPQNSSPPSGGMNTNPQNPDAPGSEGNTGNTGGQGEGEGQNPPQNNDQQSAAPPPPPPTNTGDYLPPNNTVPVITGNTSGAVTEDKTSGGVTEDETLTTTGTLNVVDPDAGESGTQTQNNTAGTYGSFSVNATGNWTYVLDNANADVQGLYAGQTLTETFDVTSIDGSTTETVTVTINGAPRDTIITGDDNANVLNGTAGDNIINALGGKDFIFASAGNDIIDGGADIDTMFYTSTSQGIIINLVDGTVNGSEIGFDTIVRLENFIAGSGNDTLIIGEDGPFFFDGQGGTDTVQFFGNLSVDTSMLQFEADNIEIIDLNKTGENTLTISVGDVQNDEGQPFLQIRGGTNTNGTTDTVNLTNEMSFDDYEGDLAVYDGEYPGGGYYEGSWQKSEGTFTDEDGTVFDVYEFFSYEADEPIATAHIEPGIQVNLPAAASLFEDFENGFDANGWTVFNAITSDANSPDGSVSARISTSPISAGGTQSVAAISELTGIPEATLDSLANDPGGPGNVTEGGAMVTTFSGQAGQIVSFDWFFSTQDYPNFNDIAFVAIDGEIVELFDVIASGNQAGSTTTEGWNTFSLALNTSGEHTIAFGVLDDSDTAVETSLSIDNIRVGPGGGGQPLHEGFENGFAANGWETINASVSPENFTEGNFSALLTTTAANEENNPDFVRTNAQEIANLAGVDVNDLDAIAETPDSPGFATEGSAIANSFYAMEGQIFSFDWFFSTYEYVEDGYGIVNDLAFVVIDGEIFELFDAESVGNETDSVATEGWNSFSIVVDNSGYHDIAFGVLDNEDTVVESSLNIDNLRLEPGGNVPHLMGDAGNDLLVSGDGENIITTGEGSDRILYDSLGDGIDMITDFGNQDTLDLTGILEDAFDPANVDGFVRATANGNDTTISVDIDGPDGPAQFTDIAILQGVGAGFNVALSIGDEDTSVTSAAITV